MTRRRWSWLPIFLPILACTPLASWNPQHWPPPPGRACSAPLEHRSVGPDAYDRERGEPYHCETGPLMSDPYYHDVDALENMP